MNQDLRFWKTWPAGHQRIFSVIGLILVTASVVALAALLSYPWPSLKWEKSLQDQGLETSIRRMSVGPYSLDLEADSFVVWESWSGSALDVQPAAYLIFGAFNIFGIIVLLSLHSTLRRFYFFAGCGLILLLASGLRLESVFPGMPNWSVTAIAFFIFLTPGLIFQFRFPSISFSKRLLVYLLTITGFVLTFYLIAPVTEPIIYLSVGLLPLTLLILPIFMILTAHEIPAGLIAVIGYSGKDRNGLRDFLILIAIYLINLFALYLSDLQWFRWSYGIHPIVLIIISGLLSVWGVRHQQKQLEGFLDAEPYGVWLMMALGLISASGIGFMYLTGNDALFATLRDLSLYIHTGYGLVFATYVVANYSPLLIKGIDVTRILYQPTVMPFFTYRFGGLVAALAFVFYNIWQRPINDTIGGYYNALAGYNRIAKDNILEEGYLKLAARFAYHNHHSNVFLAEQALAEGNADKAKLYFQNALERRPTEQTILNLVNLLEINGRSLESFTYLKEGTKKFPNSSYLNNALGLSNFGLGSSDSAKWYFMKAISKGGAAGRSAEVNLQAIITMVETDINPDSLLQVTDQKNIPALANTLASGNKKSVFLKTEFINKTDSVFTDAYPAWLNNWLIQNRTSITKEQIDHITSLIDHPRNQDYAESLHFSLAIASYESGFVNSAITHLEKAAFLATDKGRYNTILALWMLELGAKETALDYNAYAVEQGYKDAALTRAVMLAEGGKIIESIVAWDSLGRKNQGTIRSLAELSKRALGAPESFFKNLSDEERYAFCRYRLKTGDIRLFVSLVSEIKNDDLSARSIYDYSEKLFEAGRTAEASQIFRMIEGIPIVNEDLYHRIQLLELRLLAEVGDTALLEKRSRENFSFSPREQAYQKYFEGLISLPDTTKAGRSFRWIQENNLLCVDGILASAEFLISHKKDNLASYSLLARALHRNPFSVRLLKAFIRSAARLGFMDYAGTAVADLEARIEKQEFNRFMATLPPATIQP